MEIFGCLLWAGGIVAWRGGFWSSVFWPYWLGRALADFAWERKP